MTFDPNADISGGRASKRGRNIGIGAGVGGLGVLAIILLGSFLGVDLSGIAGGIGIGPGGSSESVTSDESLERCRTGADANADVTCRMVGASAALETYWAEAAPAIGVGYRPPADLVMFDGATSTGCGSATSATGPFYCPSDETISLDTAFYDDLRTQYGASGGPLAELYVVAHEWGHHVQQLAGILAASQDGRTGADSNSVRTELQADCFAGAWAGAAATTLDDSGTPYLEPLTEADVADALSAAAAVGDDRIQERAQGQADPHTFTHGTAEQRQRWFETGYEQGAGSCDTFAVSGAEL
ncbi:neutral zinc metallopeptidase [Agromyces seonyuensis]|uniref:Neutral zinc metallopeptidase n=1 Tax=Agromyces seonyuensis TaxID=2662446 RepID=A0A6I4NU10_9MICO|nr:neutral zinc metallopeptidase [Agromyces seonyuensis]MWB97868.1 neutral zinc metallopeptidase [Agromyces seonyuensis]